MNTLAPAIPVSGILHRLATTALDQTPFPHLVLRDVLPPEWFTPLMQALPNLAFTAAEYPGTGRFTVRHGGLPAGTQTPNHDGLVLREWDASPLTAAVHDFFSGDDFSRVLLERFSDPRSRAGSQPAIPVEKHAWFAGDRREHTPVFELYKDRGGYEISPHVDNPAKIVTFLWYLDDDPHEPCGTMLCRRKPGVPAAALHGGYEAARREGRSGLWMDWEHFDVVQHVHGSNLLLAFAPNDISYHGVRVPAATGRRERIVVRGFIAKTGYWDTKRLASSPKSFRG